MDQQERILKAWWHSETLTPGELPSTNSLLNNVFTSEKVKKVQRFNGHTILPREWQNIKFKKKDMERKTGFYGNCYSEYDLMKFQRDIHKIEDEIHNRSHKTCFGFYLEFDEKNKYIEDSLFIPHVNLYVKLAIEGKLKYDDSFFEIYENARKYLDEQAHSINGGEFTSEWLSQFIYEFDHHFATPPSKTKGYFLELLVATENTEPNGKFNSFFAEDILKAKNDINTTLSQYLSKPSKVVNINENRKFIEQCLNPLNTPMGRWPSPIEHRLSLMQQVAVNSFFTSSHSISSVNGPPGTGKTTLLKDIFAEITVRKALAIEAFRRNPDKALINTGYDVEINNPYNTSETVKRYVYDLDPSISQHAAVVASSNNTAVENISRDLPKSTEIDERFKEHTKPLSYARGISTKKITGGSESWGIFSIPLGKGENIKNAASLLASENFSIYKNLINDKRSKDKKKEEWEKACNEFKSLYKEIKKMQKNLSRIAKSPKRNLDDSEKFIHSNDWIWEKDQYEERQQTVFYQTNTFNEMRSLLFLKALTVLRYFLLMNVGKIGAALSLLENRKEVDLNNQNGILATKAMWNTIHCFFPVVSTTFASFSSMYKGMPKDFIPYLFIDEAGQATPLQAVGALWRSKKVLVVGDPLQIEPVQTLHSSVLEDIRKIYQVDKEYFNSNCSVQSVSDNANPYGTYVNGDKWIGIPLWVHRRCVNPMFSISNTLAYDGNMVLAKKEVGEGEWLNVSGPVTVGQYVPEQKNVLITHIKGYMAKILRIQLLSTIKTLVTHESITQLFEMFLKQSDFKNDWSLDKKRSFILLKYYYQLKNKKTVHELLNEIEQFENGKLEAPSIYIITPFSIVKNELKKDIKKELFEKMYIWLDTSIVSLNGIDEDTFKLENTNKEEAKKFKEWYEAWVKENIGTVHTFQGKEATIVYFVTGTDATKLPAAQWACKDPNLLNVAATRAKEKFFIIGDQSLLVQFKNYEKIIDIINQYKSKKVV